METVIIGMGCFWGLEARFGYLPGVVTTRVGYVGGKECYPFKNSLDYTETLQIQYDSNLLCLDEILNRFFEQSNLTKQPYSFKYRSVLFYQNEKQKQIMSQKVEELKRNIGDIYISIEPLEYFHEAEIRNQKYYLQRWKPVYTLWCQLHKEKESIVESTLAVRLNGLSRGYGTLADIKREFLDPSLEPIWCLVQSELNKDNQHTGESCRLY